MSLLASTQTLLCSSPQTDFPSNGFTHSHPRLERVNTIPVSIKSWFWDQIYRDHVIKIRVITLPSTHLLTPGSLYRSFLSSFEIPLSRRGNCATSPPPTFAPEEADKLGRPETPQSHLSVGVFTQFCWVLIAAFIISSFVMWKNSG